MGLILKKEELGSEDDFDIIERSDTPEDLPRAEYDLISGESAEDIAARNEEKTDPEAELAPDPELLGNTVETAVAAAAASSSSKEAVTVETATAARRSAACLRTTAPLASPSRLC